MSFFLLLQIACSSEGENASCPSAGETIVLEDTAFEPSSLVGEWTMRIGANETGRGPWVNHCGDSEEFSETTETWLSTATIYQDEDGLTWAKFANDSWGTKFSVAEDFAGGVTITGERPTALGTMVANFSGLVDPGYAQDKYFMLVGNVLLAIYYPDAEGEDVGNDCVATAGWLGYGTAL